MKTYWKQTLLGLLIITPLTAQGGLFVDPINKTEEGEMQAGAHYSNFKSKYKATIDGAAESGDTTMTSKTVYGVYGLNDKVDLYAGASSISAQLKGTDSTSGPGAYDVMCCWPGMEFSAGARGLLHELEGIQIFFDAEFSWFSVELFTESVIPPASMKTTTTLEGTTLRGSIFGLYPVNDQIQLYGGLDLTPYDTSKVTMEISTNPPSPSAGSSSYKLKRDSSIAIRLGAKYLVSDKWFVRAEYSLQGTQGFLIGGGINMF